MGLAPFIGSFTPISITGLVAWYDASQITGQPDNSQLSSWSDLSGNGYTLTGGGGTQPRYYNTTTAKLINGKPAVWFTASVDEYMATAVFAVPQPFTAALVFQYPADNGYYALFGSSGGAYFALNNNNKTEFDAGGVAQEVGSAVSGSPTTHSVLAEFNGASSSEMLDGITSTVAGTPGSASLGSDFVLGQYGGSAAFLTGAIAEVLIYSSALSIGNQTLLYNYLKTKWGTP